MIVVGDSSVFIALERIGALPLLPALFGGVHIPDAVWHELFEARRGPGFSPPPWLVRHTLAPSSIVPPAAVGLDAGEAEAIQLARDLHADLLLLDEVHGRRVALQLGLHTTGVVGLLVTARQRGLIPAVAPLLTSLRRAGFWLSDKIVAHALRAAGE